MRSKKVFSVQCSVFRVERSALLLLAFWLLASAFCLPAAAATITHTFLNPDGSAFTNVVLFRPTRDRAVFIAPSLTAYVDTRVTPGTNGAIAAKLRGGNYHVFLGATRQFAIGVPDSTNSYELAALLSGDTLTITNLATGALTSVASITGLGTGVATALAVNVGTAGAPVLFNGAGGTPSSLALTSATGLPLTTGVTGTLPVANGGSGVATLTAYAPVFGGTTGTGAVQSGTPGTVGQVLMSNGAGVLPTFQAAASGGTLFTNLSQTGLNTIEEKNGTNSQVLNIYGTHTDAANYERLKLSQGTYLGGKYFVIGAEEAGTGVDRQNIVLRSKGGSISAQMPDGTVAGGNVRGIGAVDWQQIRTAAERVASGLYSGIASGQQNFAIGDNSFVGGGVNNGCYGALSAAVSGYINFATGEQSFVGSGSNNNADGLAASILCGSFNSTSANYACVLGGYGSSASEQMAEASGYSAVANKYGQRSRSTVVGGHQREEYTAFIATTGATATQLRLDGTAASVRRLDLGNNESWGFTVTVTGRTTTAGGNVYNTVINGLITKGTTVASTAIVGANVALSTQNTAGAAAWVVTATADVVNGALAITVTGAAATSINWHADVRVNKVTNP